MWVLLDDDGKVIWKNDITSMKNMQNWRIECMNMDNSEYNAQNTREFIQE